MNKLISNIALNEPMIHAFINKKIDNLEEFINTFPDHLSSEELQRKPLLGVPVVIKDNINVKSLPTTAASKILKTISLRMMLLL